MKTITFRLITYLKYSLIFAMLFSSIGSLYAQDHRVSGTITHEGTPLLGATIMIKDAQRGTTTDMDGYFELLAKEDDTLVVSYLGYETKEIPIQGRTTIHIELTADADMLDAVEITGGYYSMDERTRTGNVVKVDSDQLQQQVIHSPMEALQGRVAGLEVQTRTGLSGQAPIVTLRGESSLRGVLQTIPLYVIDGIAINNAGLSPLSLVYEFAIGLDPLSTLDPSLIESIEVLKDADATAIYGSRGANGVIIINTKRGKQGKTKFELQAETGVSWVGKFMKLMNTDQYLEMRREAFENDGVTPTEANAPDLLLWDQNRYTDWQKELIGGTAEFQKYQASVSGGNAQTSFLLSGGFQKETTVFPGDFGFQNNNLHANINHRSENNRFQLNTSINYGYRKSNLFNSVFFVENGIRLAPNTPALFNKEGDINWELDEFDNPTFDNPMAGLADPNIIRTQSLQWNGSISYRFLNSLKIDLNMGLNSLNNEDNNLSLKKNFNPLISNARTILDRRVTERDNFLVEPIIYYTKKYNRHALNTLIGNTYEKNKSRNFSIRGESFFSDSQNRDISLADEKNIIRDNLIEYRYVALFGRIGYSYADKYHLNLTGRRDGSSRFGEKNRFGNFGAIGAAWEFYKESYIVDNWDWLSYGKLKGSYGTTGSDNIGDYQYRDTFSNIFVWPGSLSSGGLIPTKLNNPYYHWEKNTKLELALDVGLWEEKVLLATSWYRERSGNQLIDISLPSITGFTSLQDNFPATVENSGWEFVLQTTPIQSSNFVWNSNLNITIPKNRLVDFPDLESSSYASHYEIGKSLNIRKLYNYTGIDPDTGKYTFGDINGDGVLNNEDRVVVVDMSRKFYGGWNNNLQYKNWDLSFLFEFVKHKGLNPITAYGTHGSGSNMSIEYIDRWQNDNPNGEHQGYTQDWDSGYYNYTSSDANIVDASFIRMKSLSLNYQLPADILRNLNLQHAQVYLNAQNLFTVTPYKGFDAQSPGGLNLPTLTSVHLGIKLTL